MPELINCIDLDDTFVVSRRKQKDGLKYEAVGQNRNGDWISFRDPKQKLLFEVIREKGRLIPITGRRSASLALLKMEFSSFKIVSHGAIILDASGKMMEDWSAINRLASFQQELKDILGELKAIVPEVFAEFQFKMAVDQGFGVYIEVKGEMGLLGKFKAFLTTEKLLPSSWMIHHNLYNMAILPPCSRKEKALAWLQEHHLPGDALFLGFGDSQSDLPFMQLCDFACFPQGSQIGKQLTFQPHH